MRTERLLLLSLSFSFSHPPDIAASEPTPAYTLTKVDASMPDSPGSKWVALGDGGDVLGSVENDDRSLAVLWDGVTLRDLGRIEGFSHPRPVAINRNGDAVGYGDAAAGFDQTAFLFRDGEMKDIERWLGDHVEVADVSNGGHLVGVARIGAAYEGYVWTDPRSGPKVVLPGQSAVPRAVAADGTVGGHARFGEVRCGFVWRDGDLLHRLRALGPAAPYDGQESSVLDVSDAGHATGWIQVGGTNPYGPIFHAFVVGDAGIRVIGVPASVYWRSKGLKVARDGTVLVECSRAARRDYYLWKAGEFTEVSRLVDESGFVVDRAVDMNSGGSLLVHGTRDGEAGTWVMERSTCSRRGGRTSR